MRIGTLFGVDIVINPLFLISFVVAVVSGYFVTLATAFIVLLCHEIGHCLAARALKLPIEKFTVMPFGVNAKVQDALELRPLCEAAVAACGPAVNAFLALMGVFVQFYLKAPVDLILFIQVNLLIGGLNMIPALPLDGGRILRATVCYYKGLKKGMKVVVWSGRVIVVLSLALGIYCFTQGVIQVNFFMIAGLLLFYSIRTKQQNAFTHFKNVNRNAAKLSRASSMGVRHMAVNGNVSLNEVTRNMTPGRYHVVTVVSGTQRLGELDEGQIMDEILRTGGDTILSQALRHRI